MTQNTGNTKPRTSFLSLTVITRAGSPEGPSGVGGGVVLDNIAAMSERA